MDPSPPIALFTWSLSGGGVQRVWVVLAKALVRLGIRVDVVLVRARGDLMGDLPEEVRAIDLSARS